MTAHDPDAPCDSGPFARDLELAIELADVADSYTLPRFDTADFTLGQKDDRTEVTEVDRGCEAILGERVVAARPDHGFFGEEHGLVGDPDSAWRWIVDPIDGTSGFVRGIPVWASLIALTHHDEVVVAAVSAPALGRRWWATRGGGAFANGRRCEVSAVDDFAHAQVSITHGVGWDEAGLTGALVSLQQRARRSRGFGDFWQHCLVAEGALDVAVDAIGVAPYDLAAVSLLVTEAGGRFTDRHGEATYQSNSAISTNGILHPHVLATLTP